MNYTITSENFEGKKKGEAITAKQLQDLELNADALIAGGHLTATTPTKTATVEETK